MKKKIIAVIPARGNSKGIPKKNIVKLLGNPLIYYTIKEAKKSKLITDLVLSTDSTEIRKIGKKLGAKVPFIRPRNLSTDFIQTLPVVKHAVKYMERKNRIKYDFVILLQPTSPLRKSKDIDYCLKRLVNSKFDSIVSVTDVGGNHPFRMKIIKNGRLLNFIEQGFEDMRPRQKLKKIFIRNGAIYASKRKIIMEKDTLVGKKSLSYIMSKKRSINIDTAEDLLLAKLNFKKK